MKTRQDVKAANCAGGAANAVVCERLGFGGVVSSSDGSGRRAEFHFNPREHMTPDADLSSWGGQCAGGGPRGARDDLKRIQETRAPRVMTVDDKAEKRQTQENMDR
ncbi:unnamed protein product [Pieris brassicae]|uniref:Uncharacterized protein n=1 Tax=Pieris brassicae TaxID=7116 RepID=A0A9P0TAM7_PIEBR|nr:unnamed protein product [Pieris brassicae]